MQKLYNRDVFVKIVIRIAFSQCFTADALFPLAKNTIALVVSTIDRHLAEIVRF